MDHLDLIFEDFIDHAVPSNWQLAFELIADHKDVDFLSHAVCVDHFNVVKFPEESLFKLALHYFGNVIWSIGFITSKRSVLDSNHLIIKFGVNLALDT